MQGFYLYLYLISVTYVIAMYITMLRDKTLKNLLQKNEREQQTYAFDEKGDRVNVSQVKQYLFYVTKLQKALSLTRFSCTRKHQRTFPYLCNRLVESEANYLPRNNLNKTFFPSSVLIRGFLISTVNISYATRTMQSLSLRCNSTAAFV